MWHGVFSVDDLELLNLLSDEGHDTDAAKNVLPTQTLGINFKL